MRSSSPELPVIESSSSELTSDSSFVIEDEEGGVTKLGDVGYKGEVEGSPMLVEVAVSLADACRCYSLIPVTFTV